MDKSIKIQGFSIICQYGSITVPQVIRLIETTFNIKFNLASHRQSLARHHGNEIEILERHGRHYVLK